VSYLLLADLVVLAHAGFVLFVVCGGLAVLRWPRLAWLHLPAVVWGVIIEVSSGICPLTYLENYFRKLGGAGGYELPFVARYFEPILYPVGLTSQTQLFMGVGLLLFNTALYGWLWRHSRRQRRES